MHVNCDDYVNGITSTLMLIPDVMFRKLLNELPSRKRIDHAIEVMLGMAPLSSSFIRRMGH
jgi:hypothetical protein